MDNRFKFLYWDDLGDSQDYVDNQKQEQNKTSENEEADSAD